MNKIYIIAPTILLAIYIFFYRGFLVENETKVAQVAQEKAAVLAAEAERKAATEKKSREDTEKRAADRAASCTRRSRGSFLIESLSAAMRFS
jgi:hypothetical protein